jgi:hypothetical protein
MSVIINRLGTSAVIHTAANATYVVAGNSATSNIATGSEVITGGSITQAWWGVANGGYWEVKRGSSTVLILTESGYADYAGAGVSLVANSTGNVVITLNGSNAGYCMLEIQKTPTITGYTT